MLNQFKLLRVLQLIAILQESPAKSIQHLAKLIETTDRSVYRYLDLIRACGFDVQRDAYNRYFIVGSTQQGIRFTTEEAQFLTQLVLTAGKRNKLKDAVLSKIYLASDVNIVARHLVNAKNGLIVERLAQAIANKEQVILKRYHSINSETISDRLVEPFGFTDNYHTVMAYEVTSQEDKHEQQIPDAFGFSFTGEQHTIEFALSLKAYLLLKDEYPRTLPYIKYNPKTDRYDLRITVNDRRPIERFLRGTDDGADVNNESV
jgi:hypothetical protein